MKTGDMYRFSLSWTVQSEDGILAGEFLEALGHKKSRFLVKLIADYVRDHPDEMDTDGTIKVVLESSDSGRALIETVKTLVLAELEGQVAFQPRPPGSIPESPENEAEIDVSFMLDNLDKWGQD